MPRPPVEYIKETEENARVSRLNDGEGPVSFDVTPSSSRRGTPNQGILIFSNSVSAFRLQCFRS